MAKKLKNRKNSPVMVRAQLERTSTSPDYLVTGLDASKPNMVFEKFGLQSTKSNDADAAARSTSTESVKVFKIDKNVPIPRPRRYFHRTFYKMNIGDSFFVAITNHRDWSRVRAACHNFTTRHKEFQFAVRKVPNGLRIWRINP